MKRIYIPIFFCLLLTACQQQPSTPGTPDSNATIAASVTQTLAAQTIEAAIAQTVAAKSTVPGSQPTQPPNTPDSTATIAAGVAQTLAAQQPTETAIAQTVAARPIQPPASATPSTEQTPESTPTTTIAPTPTSPNPKIVFTSVPPKGSSEDVYGKVEGVNPEMYVVALYIRVGGRWWTKPYWATPTCPIASDGTWDCPYATGGNDPDATVIRAYLIPIGYTPPAADNASDLSRDLEKKAAAWVEATR